MGNLIECLLQSQFWLLLYVGMIDLADEQMNFGAEFPCSQDEHQLLQSDNDQHIQLKPIHNTNLSKDVENSLDQKQLPSNHLGQPQFNPLSHAAMESHSSSNVFQQCQLNIPNAHLVNAVVNFMSNNLNQNQSCQSVPSNVNELFSIQSNEMNNQCDDAIVDSFSSMSISSGPILDSQFAVEMCGDFIKHLDNNGGETIVVSNDQNCMPTANEQMANFCTNEDSVRRSECYQSFGAENIGWDCITSCNPIV